MEDAIMEEEKVKMELELAESKRENLSIAIEQMHYQVSSFLLLTLQWKELDEHFRSIRESIEQRFGEAQRSVAERYEEVEGMASRLRTLQKVIFREVEAKSRELEEKEGGIAEREREIESREKQLAEMVGKEAEWIEKRLEVKRKSVEERFKEVELEEKEFESVKEMVDKRSDKLEKEEARLCSVKKWIEERGKEVGLKENELGLMKKSIEERGEQVEAKERELSLMRKSIERRGEEVELKERELGLMKKRIDKRGEQVKLKERLIQKNVKLMERDLGVRLKSIEDRGEEVELKERELGLGQKSIQDGCEKVESLARELALFHKEVEKRSAQVELKETKLHLMQKSIEERCKEVDLKEMELGLLQKSFKEQCLKELELKQKHFESSMKGPSEEAASNEEQFSSIQNKNEVFLQALELKGNQHYSNQNEMKLCSNDRELREKQLDVNQKMMEERPNELELKGEQINLTRQSMGESFKYFGCQEKQSANILHPEGEIDSQKCFVIDKLIYSSSADLQFCISMDGKNLQMFLNKRFTGRQSIEDEVFIVLQMSSDPAKLVLDAMQGFYPPHLKEGDMEFETSIIRRSCILLLQQLKRVSPPIKPCVKEAAMRLAGEWKAKMRPEAENSLEVLGFLQLVGTYGLAPGFNLEELLNHFQTVAQHRQSPESCQALGLADRVPMGGDLHSQLKMGQLEYSQANYAIDYSSASHLFFANIARSMQLLSNEHSVDEYLTLVSAALEMSSNPAKLVLDALRGFYQLGLEKGNIKFKESDNGGCILLLEQLKKVSPEINSHVKEEAMKLAIEWKAKFREENENSLEVLTFLLLLATYGLESAINGNEFLTLFKDVGQQKEAPQLCRDLGFVDKISDYVKFLIEKKERLEAIRYISAFELDDKLLVVPLLEDYLKHCEKVFRKTCKKRNYSAVARAEAADKEIAALREVMKYIADYKLESKILLEDLERRIIQLEKQKENRKCFAPSPAPKDQLQFNSVNKRPRIAVSPETAQSTSNCNAPERH